MVAKNLLYIFLQQTKFVKPSSTILSVVPLCSFLFVLLQEFSTCHSPRRRREEEGKEGGVGVSVVQQIDKDVVRTDRSHPYYRGEGNRHVGALR